MPDPASRLHSAARSHVGLKRRINEDRLLDDAELQLWAVADGMGGHAAGDRAAQAAVDALRDRAAAHPALTDDIVTDALHAANRAILAEAGGVTSGTTVVAMYAEAGVATIFWAGDSRAYRWRDGALTQLTRDHSLVQTLVDQGVIDAEEAEHHPHANVVTRALGATAALAIDRCESAVLAGDLFLLCSDGLSKALPAAQLGALLGSGRPLEAIADALIAAALARDGSDNITLVAVRAD